MVALEGAARDPHADTAVEEQWCNELESLRSHISSRGSKIAIIKAVPAGSTPLKVVSDTDDHDDRAERILRESRLQ
jgi:hypothetical protein